jgi:hypothetical protein
VLVDWDALGMDCDFDAGCVELVREHCLGAGQRHKASAADDVRASRRFGAAHFAPAFHSSRLSGLFHGFHLTTSTRLVLLFIDAPTRDFVRFNVQHELGLRFVHCEPVSPLVILAAEAPIGAVGFL